jgi:pimeloyl-ACP methyl ester carboxylesterase
MTLAHDVTGTGPPVVFLHSGATDRRMWNPQWTELAGYHLIRCDFRGFGDSPLATTPYRDDDDVLDLLDELGIEQATLVGSSHGGAVAMEVAARWPDRITDLFLLCAGEPDHEPSELLRALGVREDELMATGDLAGAVELNVTTWLGPSATEATRDDVREMQRHAFEVQAADTGEWAVPPVEVDLSAITARCLAVSGALDVTDFRQIAAGLPHVIKHARHLELPWAGHLPSMERPAEITALLTEFLSERVPHQA